MNDGMVKVCYAVYTAVLSTLVVAIMTEGGSPPSSPDAVVVAAHVHKGNCDE
jgi:hypothetical protein